MKMEFQIRDKENNPITFGELDKQAAKFWDVPVNAHRYACPKPGYVSWYNMIGYVIALKQCNTWNDVKGELLKLYFDSAQLILDIYFPLIDMWESKSYKPVSF